MAKEIVSSDEARADMRAIDRSTALGLLTPRRRIQLLKSPAAQTPDSGQPHESSQHRHGFRRPPRIRPAGTLESSRTRYAVLQRLPPAAESGVWAAGDSLCRTAYRVLDDSKVPAGRI